MITLAEHAQLFGARWRANEILKIEQGERRLTIDALAILANALTVLRGKPVGLADLLQSDEPLDLAGSGRAANGETLLNVLLAKKGASLDRVKPEPLAAVISISHFGKRSDGTAPPLDFKLPTDPQEREELRLALTQSESELRIARSMGLDPYVFAACCLWMWGLFFSHERNRRAGKDANAQKRGNITRIMKDELREAISRGNG